MDELCKVAHLPDVNLDVLESSTCTMYTLLQVQLYTYTSIGISYQNQSRRGINYPGRAFCECPVLTPC